MVRVEERGEGGREDESEVKEKRKYDENATKPKLSISLGEQRKAEARGNTFCSALLIIRLYTPFNNHLSLGPRRTGGNKRKDPIKERKK